MDKSMIGVGIIGANAQRGWAVDAHIPALQVLDGAQLVAVSTSRASSAAQAAKQFDVALAFDKHQLLVARPEVDVVAVTVKVPYHLELTQAALTAGKAVYCEWPLGNGLREAELLAAQAREAGVYAAVGLQARSSPVINYVKDLIAQGYIGEVLSSTIVADAANWGADVRDCYSYLLDSSNGASMLSIPFGHTMDAFCYCLGEFAELSATTATRRPRVRCVESGQWLSSDVPDQVAISGILQSGAVASVHFRGGLSRGEHFVWQINGSAGDLVVKAQSGHIQMMPLTLYAATGDSETLAPLAVPPAYNRLGQRLCDNEPAAGVARAYLSLIDDFRSGQRSLPGFDEAVLRHRMLDAIERAACTGVRQSYC